MKFIEWARRRRTQMYASYTAALSITTAIAFVPLLFHIFSLKVTLVSITVTIVLVLHAIREGRIHNEALVSWADTYGRRAIRDYTNYK